MYSKQLMVCGLVWGCVACGPVGDVVDAAGGAASTWVDGPSLEQRRTQCDADTGRWASSLVLSACTNGEAALTLSWDGTDDPQATTATQACQEGAGASLTSVCTHQDAAGRFYFNDGPSTPHPLQAASHLIDESVDQLNWNSIMWDAAVNHDYCYHHNGSTYHYAKSDCDLQFYTDLSAVCARNDLVSLPWFTTKLCQREAAGMYLAVRSQGDEAWAMMDTYVEYPAWKPLWKVYEMAGPPDDAGMAAEIDALVGDDETML